MREITVERIFKSGFMISLLILVLFYSTAYANPLLTCGETVSGSISSIGEVDEYTFSANAGDRVTIRVAVTYPSGMNPSIELWDGSTLIDYKDSPSASYVYIDKTLPENGRYKIKVFDYNHDETGNYKLIYQNLITPCNVGALTCGNDVFPFYPSGRFDFTTFTAAPGDVVTIRAVAANWEPYIELYDSTGTQIAHNYSTGTYSYIDIKLVSGGVYTVIFFDGYPQSYWSNYRVVYQNFTTPCNATGLLCGQLNSGTLSTNDGFIFYTFTPLLGGNTTIRMHRTSGTTTPILELYNSDGNRLSYQYFSSESVSIETDLIKGNTYIVAVHDSRGNETGSYNLQMCEVMLNGPNGDEIIEPPIPITWTASSSAVSQDIWLSEDGGASFPYVIASGLPGNLSSYDGNVPLNLKTTEARIRVSAKDSTGATISDDSDNNFIILQNVPQTLRSYDYDKLSRLKKITYEDQKKTTYTYDTVGNRLTMSGVGVDSDNDDIGNDGDNNGISGDHPCSGGNTFNCDDNCINIANTDQADIDNDGIGNACDNCTDIDHDSYATEGGVCGLVDCNDNNVLINPTTFWYRDSDMDGHGNSSVSMQQCLQPMGYILDNTDCDDNDANIYPGGPPVRISGTPSTYYSTLQTAYDATHDLDTIQSKAVSFTENLNINGSRSVVFQGGQNCNYSALTGKTTVIGNVIISSGSSTIKDFSIEGSGGGSGLSSPLLPSDLPSIPSHPTSTPKFILE